MKYGARRNLLVFARAVVDEPFVAHNRELLEMLQPALERAFAEKQSASTTAERVKWVLKRIIAGSRPHVAIVARELGLRASGHRDRTKRPIPIGQNGASRSPISAHADRTKRSSRSADRVTVFLGSPALAAYWAAWRQRDSLCSTYERS